MAATIQTPQYVGHDSRLFLHHLDLEYFSEFSSSLSFKESSCSAEGSWDIRESLDWRYCRGSLGGYFGGAFSTVIAGMIADSTGSYSLAFITGGIIAGCSALCYWFLVKKPIEESAG